MSDRHKFKNFNLSLKGIGEPSGENFPRLEMNAKHGACVDTDDEDESSSPSSSSSNIAKIMNDTDAVSTAHKESTSIRSGGIPLDNSQWTSHLARNLAEGTRRTKSPPGTPQSHELEEERSRLNATQSAKCITSSHTLGSSFDRRRTPSQGSEKSFDHCQRRR